MYFYFSGLSLLRPGGVFCFINSNSWLDVEYGAGLQDFLLQRMKILDIYDNQTRRTFKAADINTIIVAIQRPSSEEDIGTHNVRFVAFRKPFEESLTTANLRSIEQANSTSTEDFRLSLRSQLALREEGLTPSRGRQNAVVNGYAGAKWGGRYLRAPDIFFEILELAGDRMVRIGNLADVDSGINTRANDFFYFQRLPEEQWPLVHVENRESMSGESVIVRSEIGVPQTRNCEERLHSTFWAIERRFLRPVILEPQDSDTISIASQHLRYLVLSAYEDWGEISRTGAGEYIAYAMQSHRSRDRKSGHIVEGLAVHQRVELSKRRQIGESSRRGGWWYTIRDKNYGRILLPKRASESFRVLFNPEEVTVNQNLYSLINFDSSLEVGLLLYLNSGLAAISRELLSRANLGQGVLENAGVDWAQLPCPNERVLTRLQNQYTAFESLINRPIDPIDAEFEKPDKMELDEVILSSLGAGQSNRARLAEATVALVHGRIAKAASLRAQRNREARISAVEKLRGIWAGVPEEITEDDDLATGS